jgi:NADH-quinone oxidoreductase E subunit
MKQQTDTLSRQEHDNVLVRLKEAQSEYGYVTLDAMKEISESLGVTLGDVYGVATFYSFLSVKPLGRNVIRVCRSLPCHLKGAETIVETLEKALGIVPGETTADGRFSLELANCIGACDHAPAMLVNGELHGDLTPGGIAGILEAYK